MSKATIKPVGKRVLVRPESAEEKTKSGIIIPDTARKEKPERGEVIAIGESLEGVSVGDTIVFSKYGYDDIKIDGVEYYVVKHDDVVAVVKKS
jgi:chaperonin GroES